MVFDDEDNENSIELKRGKVMEIKCIIFAIYRLDIFFFFLNTYLYSEYLY